MERVEEGSPVFHPLPLGPELRIYAKRGGDSQEGRWGGALVASRVGYSAWNPAKLCCTKLLSCAALTGLILSWHDDNHHLGFQPRGKHQLLLFLHTWGFLWSCLGQVQVLVFASEGHHCTNSPGDFTEVLMEKCAFPKQSGTAASSLFKGSQQYPMLHVEKHSGNIENGYWKF